VAGFLPQFVNIQENNAKSRKTTLRIRNVSIDSFAAALVYRK